MANDSRSPKVPDPPTPLEAAMDRCKLMIESASNGGLVWVINDASMILALLQQVKEAD